VLLLAFFSLVACFVAYAGFRAMCFDFPLTYGLFFLAHRLAHFLYVAKRKLVDGEGLGDT
jgi:hypothetical protein